MMNPEDIMRAFEQVAAQTEQDQRVSDVEAYIRDVASDVALHTRSILMSDASNIPEPTRAELKLWSASNTERVAMQISQVAILLLRRELFGK